MSAYDIRAFRTIEELRGCVALQEETWGHGFSERVAPAILKVSQILGGVAAGAYDAEGTLAGFVFGMTGPRDGELVHWSDMLAVRRGIRDTGLGTELKRYQRDVVRERGVRTMLWTFDPLQSRNAYLNFAKLGITAHEYVRDMYGQTDSPLHRGIGTDRLIAVWDLESERTSARLDGRESPPAREGVSVALGVGAVVGDLPRPGTPKLGLEAERVGVAIPRDMSAVMAASSELAVAWREATRAALVHYLDRGYEARELFPGEPASEYLLVRREA